MSSGVVRSDRPHRRATRYAGLLRPFRNLLLRFGLEDSERHHFSRDGQSVSRPAHRRFLPSLPKDFLRRRLKRKLGGFLFLCALSFGVAYAITRPVGGRGFTLSGEARRTASLPVTSAATPAGNSTTFVPVRDVISSGEKAVDGYHLDPGPHTVAEVPDIVLHDAKRNKNLHVRLFYPTEPGKYPVIVFSHGAGGSQTCCEELTRHWASYGYVTIQPTHDDSAVQRRNSGEEDIRFMQAVRDALKKPALWQSRPQDISFVLDSLPALQQRIPALRGKMDSERIGMAGHSMGSYTAEAIAGALVDLPGHPGTSLADPRVKAVLCLSPQGPGQFGLTEHSFDRISLPYLGITGSLDSLGPVASPAWHKIPFERSVEGDKYHLFIQGANHMSFITAQTLLPANAARGQAILGYTNSASLAFFDAYLNGDTIAKNYLESGSLEEQSRGAAKMSRR